jgi:hypothetical protein
MMYCPDCKEEMEEPLGVMPEYQPTQEEMCWYCPSHGYLSPDGNTMYGWGGVPDDTTPHPDYA